MPCFFKAEDHNLLSAEVKASPAGSLLYGCQGLQGTDYFLKMNSWKTQLLERFVPVYTGRSLCLVNPPETKPSAKSAVAATFRIQDKNKKQRERGAEKFNFSSIASGTEIAEEGK